MNMNPESVVAVAELIATLVELLRSSTESRETVLSVDPLQLDLMTRTARRGERTIDLLPREFLLAEYTMRRQGQVLTRAVLFREVWNYKFIPRYNLVDVHVGRLRRKIDQTDEWPMIYTIRGQGFVLRAPQLAALQCRTHDRTAAGVGFTVLQPPLPSEFSALLNALRNDRPATDRLMVSIDSSNIQSN
jgi:DNA-binding winged helix-turn-helix (wHTH) protein